MDPTYRLRMPTNLLALLLPTLIMVAPAGANTIGSSTQLSLAELTTSDSSYNTLQAQKSSAWISASGLENNTSALLKAIADAEAHGLDPSKYNLNSLEQDLDSFVTNSENNGAYISKDNISERQSFEKKLNNSFVQLANDLGRGALDAQATQRMLYREPPSVDTNSLLERLNTGEATVSTLLQEVSQSSPYYTNLVDHMRSLLRERDSGFIRTKVQLIDSVKVGSSDGSVIDLRKRLVETGDLPDDGYLSPYFGEDVEQAIMDFQARHGITATGELNDSTVIALNATVDDDIEEVAMNLERWRWMPRELGMRHILINIPAYQLTMMNGEQRIVDMGVVVGSKRHQTPVFSKGAKYVEVAPTWTVPASITNNEIIPIEKRKPGYIDSENMDYYKWVDHKLVRVPRSQITPEDFHKKPFPYVLRQRAGDDNVLGRVKILMPNKYAIYMHDTQAKKLFAKTDRAFSHGCIRLSDPQRLSSLLLQLDGKSPEETESILAKETTTRVTLHRQTPTHISYFTAWIGDDGKLNKRKDVYKHNKKLLASLKSQPTLLKSLKSRKGTILAEQEEL